MNLYTTIFVLSIILIVYPYIIYPVIVRLMVKSSNEVCIEDPEIWPMVSIVISFYNAHEAVTRKVENLLLLDYPPNRWEVVFVSDGSNEDTVSYLGCLNFPMVKVLNLQERVGKTEAENRARSVTSGDIVVFTDCTAVLDRNVLKVLVRFFSDPHVGAVSTVDILSGLNESPVTDGENAYVKQEMRLRKWESMAGMMIGLSGSCYACRKSMYLQIPAYTTRDLAVALYSLKRGYINISASKAFCFIKTQDDINKEFQRKVRTINNGLATVIDYKEMLNIFKYGRISFAIYSHKILRWLSFPILVVIFISSLKGFKEIVQQILIAGQLLIYIFALVSYLSGKVYATSLMRVVVNYVIACFAAFVAIIELLCGKHYAMWNPTKR